MRRMEDSSPWSRRRGGAAIKTNNKFLIDGEYVTQVDLLEKTGLTLWKLRSRLARERKKPGPVTMAGLLADK